MESAQNKLSFLADSLYPRSAGHVLSVYDTHVCDEAANVCSIIDVCPTIDACPTINVCPTIDVCPIKYDFTVNSQHGPISTSPSVQSCPIDNTFVRVETPDVCPVTDQLAINSLCYIDKPPRITDKIFCDYVWTMWSIRYRWHSQPIFRRYQLQPISTQWCI